MKNIDVKIIRGIFEKREIASISFSKSFFKALYHRRFPTIEIIDDIIIRHIRREENIGEEILGRKMKKIIRLIRRINGKLIPV